MSAFSVRVRTSAQQFTYRTIGTDSVAVHMDAIDRFGVCAVTVTPETAEVQ